MTYTLAMYARLLPLLFMLALAASPVPVWAEQPNERESGHYRIMSFNIRTGAAPDGENAWPKRRDHVAAIIADCEADIIGLQEAHFFQREELLELLPGFTSHGIGRDRSGLDELNCILYRSDRFLALEGGTFWLSEQPGVPGSVSWDSSMARICTWLRLYDIGSARAFYVYNTHFDHRGPDARSMSAALLIDQINTRRYPDPVVITGDFNAGESSEPIKLLLEHYADSFRVLHTIAGEVGTYNGFKNDRSGQKIDYVFIDGNTVVHDAGIIFDTYGEDLCPSDHYPVWAELSFE